MSQQGFNYFPYAPMGVPPRAGDAQQTFIGFVRDNKVFRSDPQQGPVAIGVPTNIYDDLQADYDKLYATCQEYYDALVKAGIIVPEPTQEEIIRKQAEQLNEATQIIAQSAKKQESLYTMLQVLTEKVEALSCAKGGSNERSTENIATPSNGIIPKVEVVDQPSVADNARLPELPPRPDEGDSGEKHTTERSSKRSRPSSKRAGG